MIINRIKNSALRQGWVRHPILQHSFYTSPGFRFVVTYSGRKLVVGGSYHICLSQYKRILLEWPDDN